MMRKTVLIIGLLALAGCNEHQGWNPNYQMSATPYGRYVETREVALMTGSEPPATIPVALPVKAPTAAEIKGRPVMQSVAAMYRRDTAKASTSSDANLPVVRSGPYPGSTPVLVRYAFAAKHAPGTQLWTRQGGSQATAAKACASYPTPARAQTAFLASGGPDADPQGMDPDGDGFVCGWDPAPYRVDQL